MDVEEFHEVSSENEEKIIKIDDNVNDNPLKSEPQKKASLKHYFVSAFCD